MVVNDAKTWCFVAVPKVGTCTMQLSPGGVLLSPAFGGRYVGDPHHDGHRMDAPAGYRTFAVVRSPESRIESMYRHCRADFPGRPESASFELFVRGAVAGTNDGGWPNFNEPQAWWLAKVPNPVELLRLDHLEEDLRALGLHDEDFAVDRLNLHPAAPIAWTDELRGLVAEWGKDDPAA